MKPISAYNERFALCLIHPAPPYPSERQATNAQHAC